MIVSIVTVQLRDDMFNGQSITDVDHLMRNADQLMYEVKEKRKTFR